MDMFARLCGGATGPVGVAVSGGGDSLALLMLAHDWARQTGHLLIAFTVDHALRPEAAAEAEQVKDICQDLGIAHETLVWTAPVAKQAAARRARHALMAQALKAAGGNRLLLGHTLDDQCETFFMRVRQGSTWYGLAGMQPLALSPVWPEGHGVRIVRPVLTRTREDLRKVLRHKGLEWAEDPSNRDTAYERVRVRGTLSAHPRLSARILACHERFQALRQLEERLIGRWVAQCVETTEPGRFMIDLQDLPVERSERVLGMMIQIAGGREVPPRRDGLQPLNRRLRQDRAFDGATLGGVLVYRKRGRVTLQAEPAIAGKSADFGLAQARLAAQKALFLADT